MSTRDELKEKWALLKATGQTDIRITINSTNKKIIQKVINELSNAMLNKFDLSLTWDIEIQPKADPHNDCEIWSKCPLWIQYGDGRRI